MYENWKEKNKPKIERYKIKIPMMKDERIPKTTYDITLDSQRNCKKNRKERDIRDLESEAGYLWHLLARKRVRKEARVIKCQRDPFRYAFPISLSLFLLSSAFLLLSHLSRKVVKEKERTFLER